ncbi:MAG TPA: YkgJ family cysteine cluster protein [Verrucomicrobiae bacterium]
MNPTEELLSNLKGDSTQAGVRLATRQYFVAADANAEGFLKTKKLTLACRQGCALCCVLRVHVRAHEVFAVADFIGEKFSAKQREELLARLEVHVKRIAPLTRAQHETTNVVCPLLVDSVCSVYPVRPFACRGHHSNDLSACQYSYDHPEDDTFPGARNADYFALWETMTVYGNAAFKEAGFDSCVYEFGSALLAALRNPASARRWRDRKNPLLGENQAK